MSKKIKIAIAILIAVSSLTAIVVLANEVANPIFFPVVYQNYGAKPTPTPNPSVVITGFQASHDPEEDYVQLKNITSSTIDMTGWWMKAENQSNRYNFPSNFKLGAGQIVNVRSGVGTNSATNLYIGLPYSLWTVAGNCAYLRNQDGILEDKECVGQGLPTPTVTPEPSVYISGFNPSTNPQNDYVTIKNSTTQSFNLTGWWMKAESETGRYDFPAGFILSSSASVNIRSGIGTNNATNLYVGLPYSLWTKANNCAYLRYKDGTLLDVECVGN
ncbi:MAG: lamin tail domain-containing protein [Anaerolineales bacterium]